jgi:glucose-6-phosphate isomerase
MLNLSYTKSIGYDDSIYADLLPEYLQKIHAREQGFYNVIDDEKIIADIQNFADLAQNKYDDIVVLAIGGSALGTTTLRDSLSDNQGPKLHILDNIDPTFIQNIDEQINYSRTLFLVVTKSGSTPETLSLYSYFSSKVLEKKLSTNNHFVFITDPKNGFLREQAEKLNIKSFAIPPNVGGRFSVLTAVGLLPAALIGIDIKALISGAKKMRDNFISEDFATNTPFQLASIQFGLFTEGYTNVVMMPYLQNLKTFAAWYAQLLGESTGKRDIDDDETGLTPIAALGATDQHSLVQQFMQGLRDKQVCIIRTKNFPLELSIPALPAHEKTTLLRGRTFNELITAECQATIDALVEDDRPVYTLDIEELNAETLGSMFMLFEGTTAFLGEFLEINAFNQPGVERSKVLTREYLEAKKN